MQATSGGGGVGGGGINEFVAEVEGVGACGVGIAVSLSLTTTEISRFETTFSSVSARLDG